MQAASPNYKTEMKKQFRNRSYMRVTIGLINQEAQASAYVPNAGQYTYYSNLKWWLDNYEVQELYATCDQDYATTDGGMYFLPRSRSDVVLNAGIVSESLLGSVRVDFPVPLSIKGLTVEFGKAYPMDFEIQSDNNTVQVVGNEAGHFVTEGIFTEATYLQFNPGRMVNGQSRFRIHQLTMGIGIYFDNRKIMSANKKEFISPISEELPTIDLSLTVENKDRRFDVENDASSVNFLEIGQSMEVIYGLELDSGEVEWIPGATLQLKGWSADDQEMKLVASDRFDSLDETYYRGQYQPEGVSLYDLADDVFRDAGIDWRDYRIDPYLKDVLIKNPVPVVTHKEALQLIANAGRCILYQDRSGELFMKSSFIPEMQSESDNAAYFSHTDRVLDKSIKDAYSLAGKDYASTDAMQYFLPQTEKGASMNTGYVSEQVAGADGKFLVNPTVEILLEAAYKCFGLTLQFGRNHPQEMIFHAFYNGALQEEYRITGLTATTVISHEFPEFDYLILEFTKGSPYNRVMLDNVSFGESTDYVLEYGTELTKTPKGIQLPKVKQLEVIRTLYNESEEIKELAKETIPVTPADSRYTFYFSNASYDLAAVLTAPGAGQAATIIDQSCYYATVEFTGVSGVVEVSVIGREYITAQAKSSTQLNPTGTVETWENPLVSNTNHAEDLAKWIGDYMKSDREYELTYRGEPRIDANDIAYLENKYVPEMLIRVYNHTLNFNGAISGSIKARRDVSYVDNT